MTLNKVFTPVTVIYKGSGFYSTDNRSSSGSSSTPPPKKKEEKPVEKKSEAPGESTESKVPSTTVEK